jgi:hypothetical protein
MFVDVQIELFLRTYDGCMHPEVRRTLAEFCAIYDAFPLDAFEDNFRLDDPKWLRVVHSAQTFLRAVKTYGWFKPGPVPDP